MGPRGDIVLCVAKLRHGSPDLYYGPSFSLYFFMPASH